MAENTRFPPWFRTSVPWDGGFKQKNALESAGIIKVVDEGRDMATIYYDPARTNVFELNGISLTYGLMTQRCVSVEPCEGLQQKLLNENVASSPARPDNVRSGSNQPSDEPPV